jgi:hypothetical protein
LSEGRTPEAVSSRGIGLQIKDARMSDLNAPIEGATIVYLPNIKGAQIVIPTFLSVVPLEPADAAGSIPDETRKLENALPSRSWNCFCESSAIVRTSVRTICFHSGM